MLVAEVQFASGARGTLSQAPHRLIVQVYPGSAEPVAPESRPTSSAQRAVTLDELRAGVAVHVVDVGGEPYGMTPDQLTVLAWVEPGEPDLELDALRARPADHFPVGKAVVREGEARVKVQLRAQTRG
jgi:hypothetical protein